MLPLDAGARRASRLRVLPPWHALAVRSFNTKIGEVLGKNATRHTSTEFVAFLNDIVANQPRGKEIRVIADSFQQLVLPVNDLVGVHSAV